MEQAAGLAAETGQQRAVAPAVVALAAARLTALMALAVLLPLGWERTTETRAAAELELDESVGIVICVICMRDLHDCSLQLTY